MTCGSEAARNRRWLLGQGCLSWLEVGTGSKLYVFLWCGLVSVLWMWEEGEEGVSSGIRTRWAEAQGGKSGAAGFWSLLTKDCSLGKTAVSGLWAVHLASCRCARRSSFASHLAATHGCRQHERTPCRDTRTASLWLFLGIRSSITALAQPKTWANLACLATRIIQLGGSSIWRLCFCLHLTYPICLCPALHPAVGTSYQRRQHVRGSALWQSALGVEDKQTNIIFTWKRLINHWTTYQCLLWTLHHLQLLNQHDVYFLKCKIHMYEFQWHLLPCSKQEARLWS